jgi:class 3 adenylate cyclase/uncharacterized protein HemY
MNSEIKSLTEQIAQAEKTTAEVVDAMNRLAVLLFEKDINTSLETAAKAIEAAQKINYEAGEATALLQQGIATAKLRKYHDACICFEKALHLREKLNDAEGIATAHAKLGTTKLYDGKYPEAIEHFNRALELRTMQGDALGCADLHTNAGIVHGLMGNNFMALKSHLQALNTYERHNENSRIASSSSNIGLIYTEQQNFDEALKMFQRALAIREQLNDSTAIGISLNNIGYVYQEQKKYEEALAIHLRALKMREAAGDHARIATTYSNLGNIYKELGNHALALNYYTLCLKTFEELKEKRGLVQAYINMGELYFEMKDFEDAFIYLSKAIQLAEETGLKNQLRKAYEYLSQLYAHQNNFQSAYEFHLKYTKLDKEISNAEISGQIAQITMRGEIEKKERAAEIERIKNVELTRAYNSLEEEKKRSESLLLNILPEEVAEELKQNGKATARFFENVTVMFTDFKGFTTVSEKLTPQQLVNELHECFKAFDEIIAKYNIEKIKTVGDAYLAASGLPTANANHAEDMLKAAIEISSFMKTRKQQPDNETFEVRIGIHSGHVVAGIVGVTKFAYDIWGDTVNTAARMEQNSEAGRINISESTYQLIKEKFTCAYRGEIEAKNKGKLKMYFVE